MSLRLGYISVNKRDSLDIITQGKPFIIPPNTPENFNVDIQENGDPLATWGEVANVTYNVYVRDVTTGDPFSKHNDSPITDNSYTIDDLSPSTYEAYVTSESVGKESDPSNTEEFDKPFGSVLLEEDWSDYIDAFSFSNSNLDENWTLEWDSAGHNFTANDGTLGVSQNFGTKYIVEQGSGGFPGNYLMSSDEIGSIKDVELTNLTRWTVNRGNRTRLHARVSGGAGSETGYFAEVTDAGTKLTIKKIINGTVTTIGTKSMSFDDDTWYWIKFRCIGNELKAKAWEHGNEEPSSWTIEVTDDDLDTTGKVGIGYLTTDDVTFISDYLKISG